MSLRVGVDGCRGAWVVAWRRGAEGVVDVAFRSTAETLAFLAEAEIAAVDVPLGLADDGPRACDRLARALLGPRRSSVFPAPVRAVLDAVDYDDARRRALAASGKSISRQAWAIVPGIRRFDEALRADPRLRTRVRETHPELAFCAWNGGRPLHYPKRRPEGRREREALVAAYFGPVFARLRAALAGTPAAPDDLADALAALWTADRVARGVAVSLPDPPPRDAYGIPTAITY